MGKTCLHDGGPSNYHLGNNVAHQVWPGTTSNWFIEVTRPKSIPNCISPARWIRRGIEKSDTHTSSS